MSKYDTTLFNYFLNILRQAKALPLNLGGIVAASGGTGGPPGGYLGYLPQKRVSYDITEAAISGYVNPNAVISGVVVNASLLDNLNHIRYRITDLEDYGVPGNITVLQDDAVVVSGATKVNFEGFVNVVNDGAGQATVVITTSGGSFLDLSDTPTTYAGQAGYVPMVKDTEDGLEFTTISGITTTVEIRDSGAFQGYADVLNFDSGLSVTVTDGIADIDVGSDSHGAYVLQTGLQLVGTSESDISWTSEVYDDNDYWTSGSPTRFTIPEDGWYAMTVGINWSNLSSTKSTRFRINGSTTSHTANLGVTTDCRLTNSWVRYLNSGDYVTVRVWNSSGNINIEGSHWGIAKLGGGAADFGIPVDYMVNLYDRSGQTVAEYPATAAGLTSALAAAGTGDVVKIPNAVFNDSFTVPAGVSLTGLSRKNSKITGLITLNNESVLENLTIEYTTTSGGPIHALTVNSSSTGYIYDCDISAIQTGTGQSYGINMNNSNSIVECWNSYIVGYAITASGFGIRRNTSLDTATLVFGGRVLGSSDVPFLEE